MLSTALVVPPSRRAEALEIWGALSSHLARLGVPTFASCDETTHWRSPEHFATVFPDLAAGKARIELPQKFWEQSEEHRFLTLLHEAIHVSIDFGVLRERVRICDLYAQLAPRVAVVLFQFPCEILAETRIQRLFPELLDQRCAQLAFRTDEFSTPELAELPVQIRPYRLFHQVLRASMFRSLASQPDVLEHLDSVIEGLWRRIEVAVPADDVDYLRGELPRLLHVAETPRLEMEEEAYDRLCTRVVELSRANEGRAQDSVP